MVKTSPSNARDSGLIPGQAAKIPHALRPKKQNIRQEQYCLKFNKDFKNGPHQKNKNLFKNIFCIFLFLLMVGLIPFVSFLKNYNPLLFVKVKVKVLVGQSC